MIPIILSMFGSKIVPAVVDAIIGKMVASPNVPVAEGDVNATRDAIAPIVRRFVLAGRWPIILGGFGTIFSGLSSLCMAIGNGDGDPNTYYTAVGGIITGSMTLYGIYKARQAVK